MPIYHPGTTNLVTKSFEDRNLTAEFDDSLCDQQSWKNSRYEGSKLISKDINVFTESGSAGWPHGQDKSFTNFPNIQRTSTALYISNTVIGGLEDPQYADIAGHSYININKILLINPIDQSVQVLEQSTEPYAEFHRFITNDFHTGAKFRAKVIDPSVGNSLKIKYTTKMNKGWLLKSFDFNFAGERYSSASVVSLGGDFYADVLTENNSMYLYRTGSVTDNFYGSSGSGHESLAPELGSATALNNRLRFRYGVIEMFTNSPTSGRGHHFTSDRMGPSFASSSIIRNKYTSQYFSGSFGFIQHRGKKVLEGAQHNGQQISHGGIDCNNTGSMGEYLSATGLGSASRFLAIDTINFLKTNNQNEELSDEEKTELFITFFQGTKDFAPGHNDERSISTFELDYNYSTGGDDAIPFGIATGSECHAHLPINHELIFKGNNDTRLLPTTSTYTDTIISYNAVSASHNQNTWYGTDAAGNIAYQGCVPVNQQISASGGAGGSYVQYMQSGVSGDKWENIEVYVQGGALGEIGNQGAHTASSDLWGSSNLTLDGFANDNFYSGSFNYDISFLDKAHTIIADIDKDTELYEGIGSLGLVLMPENSDPQVAFNVEFYLEKAGIIPDASDTTQRITPDLNIK